MDDNEDVSSLLRVEVPPPGEDMAALLLKDRLSKVRKAVRKATEDAWKQASTTSPRSIAEHNSKHDNASFLLGMDLFGQDTHSLEKGIRDKLEDVETELEKVLAISGDESPGPEGEEKRAEENDAFGEDEDPMANLAQQARSYQHKIAFLKQASLTRSELDESETWASPALTADPSLEEASRHLVVAEDHLNETRAILDRRPPSVTATSSQEYQVAQQILEGLQHSIRRQRVELVHKASTIMDQSIQFGSNSRDQQSHDSLEAHAPRTHSLSVKNSSQLLEAYKVLENLEGGPLILEESIRCLTHRIFQEALLPVLHRHRKPEQPGKPLAPWKVVESEVQPTTKRVIGVSTSINAKGMVHRLEWTREENSGVLMETDQETDDADDRAALEGPVTAWKDTMSCLQKILAFVQSRMLLERDRPCELVGAKLFGKPDALPSHLNLNALGLESVVLGDDKGLLTEELVGLIAKTCLPDALEPAQVEPTLRVRREGLLAACEPFCREMTDRNLLAVPSASPGADPPVPTKLLAFCGNLEQKYIEHRRSVLLNEARDILKNRDYHNTAVVGVEHVEDPTMAIFKLHKSSISEVAKLLVELLRKTMDESVQAPLTPENLRPSLYRTAREMLSLFRAIIPVSHGNEIANVPRTAAVLHNDCIYFAHHCLTLGLEYKGEYNEDDARGKLLRQACIFVDMVPLFRELADQVLGDMLDLQARQLAEIVGGRITYLGKALQSNESLHEWSEAETAMAAGVYHLNHLAQSWRSILSKTVFAQSLGYLVDVILTLFWDQVTKQAPTISPNARHFLLGLFRKASDDLRGLVVVESTSSLTGIPDGENGSSEWDRFQALIAFLDMQHLSQIEAALTSGVFRRVAGQELSRWIQAAHEESPHQRALLQVLSSSSQ